ncbi:hypothetical protein BSKO_08972 [Bryopsis sp. KO-2023]|nr:hypothetical protein BSKO_08972 [Bryopsis sp. KO-2023]
MSTPATPRSPNADVTPPPTLSLTPVPISVTPNMALSPMPISTTPTLTPTSTTPLLTPPGLSVDLIRRKVQFSEASISNMLNILLSWSGDNPFKRGVKAFDYVSDRLVQDEGQPFTGRSIKDKVNKILDSFEKKNRESIQKSGIQEDMTALDTVMQSLVDLRREVLEAKKKKKRVREDNLKGEALQQVAMTTLKEKRKFVEEKNEEEEKEEKRKPKKERLLDIIENWIALQREELEIRRKEVEENKRLREQANEDRQLLLKILEKLT